MNKLSTLTIKVKNNEKLRSDYESFTLTDIGNNEYFVQFKKKKSFKDPKALYDFFTSKNIILDTYKDINMAEKIDEHSEPALYHGAESTKEEDKTKNKMKEKKLTNIYTNVYLLALSIGTIISALVVIFSIIIISSNRIHTVRQQAAMDILEKEKENMLLKTKIELLEKDKNFGSVLQNKEKERYHTDINRLKEENSNLYKELPRIESMNRTIVDKDLELAHLRAYKNNAENEYKFATMKAEWQEAKDKIEELFTVIKDKDKKIEELIRHVSSMNIVIVNYKDYIYEYHKSMLQKIGTDSIWLSLPDKIRLEYEKRPKNV